MPPNHMMQIFEYNPLIPPLELLYASIILIICIIIYARTKELYDLTHHKGIQLFRETFIFLGLAYLFRIIPIFFRLTEIELQEYRLGFFIGVFLFGYASSMGLLSLLRSITWANIQSPLLKNDLFYHLISFLLAITIILSPDRFIFMVSQTLLLGIIFASSFNHQTNKKKKTRLSYYIYILLSLFWLLNIITTNLQREIISLSIIYFFSIILFTNIAIRVVASTRLSHEEKKGKT